MTERSAEQRKIDMAFAFTRAYQEAVQEHPAVREALCLKTQFPAICLGVEDRHLFAGRKLYKPLVGFLTSINVNMELSALYDMPRHHGGRRYLGDGFSTDTAQLADPEGASVQGESLDDSQMISNGKNSYLADRDALAGLNLDSDEFIRERLAINNSGYCHSYVELKRIEARHPAGSPERQQIEEMIDFWNEHSSRSRFNRALPDHVKKNMGRATAFDNRFTSGFFRVDCYSLDYALILEDGVPGLEKRIRESKQTAEKAGRNTEPFRAMEIAVEVLKDVCMHYANETLKASFESTDPDRRRELLEMSRALENIICNKPANLREAIQLFWIYNLLSDTYNYGRLDMYLGDYYCDDIDSGRLTEAEALRLIKGLWVLISEIRGAGGAAKSNTRILIGGRGRRNEANADRFATAAMQATYELKTPEPNLTLRFYRGQNEQLFQRALDMIANGNVHPILYNDDEHIPLVEHAMGASREDAEQYTPEGCGELAINGRAFGSPNNMMNFVDGLDLVLHNGFDTFMREQRGIEVGTVNEFTTFGALVDAFKKQIAFTLDILAQRHAVEHQVEAAEAGFLFISMGTHGCVENGKSVFNGGVPYLGGIIESFGLTNLSDSLAAIKRLVYDRRLMTLEELVAIMDADFEGHERERRLMLNCPKFGNDDDAVDSIYTEMSTFVNETANEAGRRHGLDYFLICNLNPGGLYYAPYTKASADGRKNGDPLAMGNNPTAGRDTQGLTALLNSMTKLEKRSHGGYVHNLKVGPDSLKGERRRNFDALLKTYFEHHGCQIMVTAIDPRELENAMKRPEDYGHLLVRVCGWTCRFTELNARFQREIIDRTLYA